MLAIYYIYDKFRCCSIWMHRCLWNFNCFNYVNEPLITTPICRSSNILLSTVDSTLKQHSVMFNPCTLVLIFIVFMLLIDIKVFKKSILVRTQWILMLFVCFFVCLSVCYTILNQYKAWNTMTCWFTLIESKFQLSQFWSFSTSSLTPNFYMSKVRRLLGQSRYH